MSIFKRLAIISGRNGAGYLSGSGVNLLAEEILAQAINLSTGEAYPLFEHAGPTTGFGPSTLGPIWQFDISDLSSEKILFVINQ